MTTWSGEMFEISRARRRAQGVDPEDLEARMPARLRRQRGDGGAVVAAQDGEQRARRNRGEAIGHDLPAGLDGRSDLEIAQIVDGEAREQVSLLGHRRHYRRQRPQAVRRVGRPFAVDGRAVVRDAGERHRSALGRAGQPSPRLEARDVDQRSVRFVGRK